MQPVKKEEEEGREESDVSRRQPRLRWMFVVQIERLSRKDSGVSNASDRPWRAPCPLRLAVPWAASNQQQQMTEELGEAVAQATICGEQCRHFSDSEPFFKQAHAIFPIYTV